MRHGRPFGVVRFDPPGSAKRIVEWEASSDLGPLGRGRCVVLLLGDVITPNHKVSLIVDFLHRDVRHEPVRIRPVPMIRARFEVDTFTRPDDFDRSTASLASVDAFGDVDRLPHGRVWQAVRGIWREVHAAVGQTGRL